MSLHCPNCHSKKIGTKNHGKKAGGAMGTAAGEFGGASVLLAAQQVLSAANMSMKTSSTTINASPVDTLLISVNANNPSISSPFSLHLSTFSLLAKIVNASHLHYLYSHHTTQEISSWHI